MTCQLDIYEQAYLGQADLLRRSYMGGSNYTTFQNDTVFDPRTGAIISSYLWQHPREELSNYNLRKKITNYTNFVRWIVDFYVQFMKQIRRQSNLSDQLQPVLSEKYNFDIYMKAIVLYGQCVIEHVGSGIQLWNPTQYRWKNGELYRYSKSGIEYFSNPVAIIYIAEEPNLSNSVVYDIAFDNLTYFNLTSLLMDYMQRNTFALFCMERGKDDSLDSNEKEVALGSDVILMHDQGTKQPGWVVASRDPAIEIREELQRQERLMLQRAGLISHTDQITERHSAISVVLQSADKTAKINAFAEEICRAENIFWKFLSVLENVEQEDISYIELTPSVTVGGEENG